jgi:hypothetical protein
MEQKKIDAFLALVAEKIRNQYNYNLKTNIVAGIVKESDCEGDAIETGVASAINSYLHWNPDKMFAMAVRILEEANLHPEAKHLSEFSRPIIAGE